MKRHKSNQQNSKKQSKVIVKDQRETARLHPLFSGILRSFAPYAYGGK